MKKKLIFLMAGMLILLAFISPKDFLLTGKVTDEQGNGIPFVTIRVKAGKAGVSSDASGNFSIRVPDSKAVLEFSAAGYQTATVNVKGRNSLSVVMKRAAAGELQEVIVTHSYGMKGAAKSKTSNMQDMNGGYYRMPQPVTAPAPYDRKPRDYNREGYDYIAENSFLKTKDNALSTFSIDVDAASYSNVRRILQSGQLPPAGAVRIEEMVNYFTYQYPQPAADKPFTVNTEISDCPWNPKHRLALIGLQGKKIPMEQLPAANLVFLIDVSGSMQGPDRLELVRSSMSLLADQLREQDKVSICVYAGSAGLVLPATNGLNKQKIKEALNALEAGGSTAGGAGIKLAYKTARENFVKGGNNRVILCTDGDFNVGQSSDDELERMIEEERKSGVFLTVLGYGTGNYQDAKMQKLADKGNGNHAYIDGLSEAKKVLVSEFGGTLFTIAKDVKLQVEFNPAIVQGYRLIGYENRMLAKEDFNDDKKDAGELGSGHTVTALYEIIPVGEQSSFLKNVDTLKYQSDPAFNRSAFSSEMMTIKLRYKQPDGDVSKLMEVPVKDNRTALMSTSDNFRFAASVAEMGLLLRDSKFKQYASYENLISLAQTAIGKDKEGYRKEFVKLATDAQTIAKKQPVKKAVEDGEEVLSKNR